MGGPLCVVPSSAVTRQRRSPRERAIITTRRPSRKVQAFCGNREARKMREFHLAGSSGVVSSQHAAIGTPPLPPPLVVPTPAEEANRKVSLNAQSGRRPRPDDLDRDGSATARVHRSRTDEGKDPYQRRRRNGPAGGHAHQGRA